LPYFFHETVLIILSMKQQMQATAAVLPICNKKWL